MSQGFPDPQLIADAQALNVFAQAVSQASLHLINSADKTSVEYAKLKIYFQENLPKLQGIIERLETDLA